MKNKCPICGREDGGEMQDHHLKPVTFKSRTKEVHDPGNFVHIHKVCHQKIHATFSEHDLFQYYHTVERLVENEDMVKFIKWIMEPIRIAAIMLFDSSASLFATTASMTLAKPIAMIRL